MLRYGRSLICDPVIGAGIYLPPNPEWMCVGWEKRREGVRTTVTALHDFSKLGVSKKGDDQ